ncbi:MAG: hypothetical protein J0647_03005 [Campylobacteraceae bacterium]|nr:hypothetical protein [Campylobacteraceae bacterium]
MINTLFLYQSNEPLIKENLELNSSTYYELDFIVKLKNCSADKFHIELNQYISKYEINHLFILLDNCDSSISLTKLYSIKKKHNLKIVFIFRDSPNSFEYIDRYYAQIAELVILDDIPFINDFYKMLEIPTYILKNLRTELNINSTNIFSSSLVNLSIQPNKEYKKIRYPLSINQQFKEIFKYISATPKIYPELLTDKKFTYSQEIYEIYWILYHIIENKNFKISLELINPKNFKYITKTFRLLKTMTSSKSLSTNRAIDTINKSLYVEYSL